MYRYWTEEEILILSQYETTAKSAYTLYHELLRKGYGRSYKAVMQKLDMLDLRKPKRYVTGHERKHGYLDIEATHLMGNIGFMLSWALLPRDDKRIYSDIVMKKELFSYKFDRRIIESLISTLKKFDVVYTYYGTRFDMPYIRTRAMEWKLDPWVYRGLYHKDLYYQVRSKLKIHSNRLEVATQFLGIKGKTPLEPRLWRLAAYGHEESLKYVLKHNEEDVKILKKLHQRLEIHCPPDVRPV